MNDNTGVEIVDDSFCIQALTCVKGFFNYAFEQSTYLFL